MAKSIGILATALAAMIASPALATFAVTVEAPKVLTTTSTFNFVGVENFDTRTSGNFTTDFGSNGTIGGTYSNASIANADLYGGAGGTGKYATGVYTIDLTTTNAGGIDYFGYWLSALNSGNVVTFYKGGTQVASYDVNQLAQLIGGNSAYLGNPSGTYAGQNAGERYAFVNFYDQGDTFDRVTISGAGHESDNQTVGNYASYSGTVLAGAVPEPASWAMMIGGFAFVGGALRGQRRKNAFKLA